MLLLKAWSLTLKDHHDDYCLQLGLANKTFGEIIYFSKCLVYFPRS